MSQWLLSLKTQNTWVKKSQKMLNSDSPNNYSGMDNDDRITQHICRKCSSETRFMIVYTGHRSIADSGRALYPRTHRPPKWSQDVFSSSQVRDTQPAWNKSRRLLTTPLQSTPVLSVWWCGSHIDLNDWTHNWPSTRNQPRSLCCTKSPPIANMGSL